MRDILNTVENWMQEDHPIVLARVTQTWGSAPRGAGSMMAFRPDLSITGSVSGGCIESAVIDEGLDAYKRGTGRLLHYGVSDDTAWQVGLSCGGKINVYTEPLDREWWRILRDRLHDNETIVTVTALDGSLQGAKVIFDAQFAAIYQTAQVDDTLVEQWQSLAQTVHSSQEVIAQDTTLFVDVFTSQPHLIMIGGAHIAIPLQAFAQMLGFRVSIIDPRRAFASQARFPDVQTILHSYPDKALPQLGIDAQTYIVVLTHDPKIDDKALITALPAHAAYIGVLSSRKTHEQRKERLRKAGLTDALIDKIHTPIGLNIGSKTPEEIALSIMAEIVAVKNGAVRKS